jgi:spore coat polysaccharide biosynthesis protein SpsF
VHRYAEQVILAILQARTSSTRLPGKVLRPLLGQPMVLRVVERIERAHQLDQLVVATSRDPSDDELADVLQTAGIVVRRGSLTDVLGRFLDVLEEFDPEHFVRLTGDNALIDPGVIDEMIGRHQESNADYTSNAIERTYPRGLDTEVVRTDALRRLAALSPDAEEREHVTLGIYRRPLEFALTSVTQSPDLSDLRWTIDYPEDFAFVERIYRNLYADGGAFGQEEILRLLRENPELARFESDVLPAR